MSEDSFPRGAALVIGGSGGIGQHVCRALADAGTDVALTFNRNRNAAESVALDIGKAGGRASIHQLSVGDDAQVKAVVADVARLHGGIHTVVYGAAPLTDQLYISEFTTERWNAAIDQETNGFFRVVRATLPVLKKGGGGSYVHLGSAGDLWWPDKDGLSIIPKAANEALIRGLAKEEGRNGVRANTVLVGVIEAGMFLELTKQGVFDQNWIDETHRLLALKRWGKPQEIGHAVVFLASNKAAYVTGQQIAVAGGFGI